MRDTLDEAYPNPMRKPQFWYVIAATLLLAAALFSMSADRGPAASGFELASELEGLKKHNPIAHSQLADGTYDTLDIKERYAFVMRAIGRRGAEEHMPPYLEDLNIPSVAVEPLNNALLKLLVTHDMAMRVAHSDLESGKSLCETLENMAELYQLSFDRDLLPLVRETLASRGVPLDDCDF